MDENLKNTLIRWSPWLISALIICGLLVQAGPILSGALLGNDDYMRLVQTRGLLAGQNWFDVSQPRFLTPEGGAMHWSRLPDLPLVFLISVLKPFVGVETAERLAVILWPLMLFGFTLAALIRTASLLGGGRIAQCGVVALFSLSVAAFQFLPGRIDHHGLMELLSLLALNGLLSMRADWKAGVTSGLAYAAMMTVAVEGLPYVLVGVAAAALLWIVRGEAEGERLAGLGGALAGAGLVFFFLDAPGAGHRSVCDAFGFGHLVAMMLGGLSFVALGLGSVRAKSIPPRLALAAGAGVATLLAAAWLAPGCLESPYGGLSDLARSAWLAHVQEARGLARLAADDPGFAVRAYGYTLAGLFAGLWMTRQSEGARRAQWRILLAFTGAALIVMVWQLRALTFAHLFASIPAGMALARLIGLWGEEGGVRRVAGIAVGMALLTPPSWKAYSSLFDNKAALEAVEIADEANALECADAASIRPLSEIPPARIFGPINLGAPMLALTPHAIYAAPYHRNVRGIEAAIEIYAAPPEEARRRLSEIGATHLLHCPGLGELERYRDLAPSGFAARLSEEGAAPDWLEPVPLQGETPLRLYRITPAAE